MFINTQSLKQHLNGHNVPRFIIGQVLEELNKLRTSSSKDVFQGLGSFKAKLVSIAEHESLTTRQRSLVERSYYCLYGNGTTRAMQIAKDLDAMAAEVSDSQWEALWPTIVKGARDFGKVDHINIDQVQPIYQLLFNKADKVKTEQFPKDAEMTKQTHLDKVVQKSCTRFRTELSQWSVLPADIKALPVWDRVFAGIHLDLVERDDTVRIFPRGKYLHRPRAWHEAQTLCFSLLDVPNCTGTFEETSSKHLFQTSAGLSSRSRCWSGVG